MAAKSPKEYVYLFFQPNEVNILEGFTTELKVMGVPKDNPNVPENVTQFVDFKVNPKKSPEEKEARAQVKVVSRTDEAVTVKGVKPSGEPADFLATPKKGSPLPRGLEARARLWVDESDLLVYAPDGKVYWLPTEAWMKAKSFDPKHPQDMKKLAKALVPLLRNEAVVANIPHHVEHERAGAAGDNISASAAVPAEPVTCFLLNLNSILLSYTPSKELEPKEQDASPFESRKY
ncbi:hypothetical protein [Pyxidicoccus sp. MSG2]|uniref:hypothetical protein n=1 Tax=Pyxidicoccus sp. MSG2 TaxID=2996790 RepID=UPI00226E0980|nr:hypothetical protein [Pyxidicoccus sp. MSG2]MCY1020811.1 hypothetical protein [Pyxidicoccus sp. MSG2]